MSRELDEQVAQILGYEAGTVDGWGTKDGLTVEIPEFSTDWARLPELLAWLHQRFEEVAIWHMVDGVFAMAAKESPKAVMLGEASGDYDAHGMTILHCLCNLVVAVAKGGDRG